MLKGVVNTQQIEQFIMMHDLPRGDFSELDMAAIWHDVADLEPWQVIVEIGVRYGKSLCSMALMAKEGVQIYGIDVEDLAGRKTFWYRSKLDTVAHFIHAPSAVIGNIWGPPIDLLHIDGDHSLNGISNDIYFWVPKVKKGGSIFFHDCDTTSPEVLKAVK